MPDTLFDSTSIFRQRFIDQLLSLLDNSQLGAFILALANSSYREDIFEPLQKRLKTRFEDWQQQITKMEQAHNQLPVDDLRVFEQLVTTGFDNLKPTQRRQIEGWQLQFNSLRSFRPARNSGEPFKGLYKAFSSQSFHFNKPFLKAEILWQGRYEGLDLRLMFNKFPFADYHGLMLIEPEQERSQYLRREDCQHIDRLLQSLKNLEGIGMAYNSLGAYASVNHQHWQFFISAQDYPVEHPCWTHSEGNDPYPLTVRVDSSLQAHWPLLERLQQQDRPFNLLLRADCVYLVERRAQGSYPQSPWSGGFAWSEVMGNLTLNREDDFQALNGPDIRDELQRLNP